MTGGRKVRTWRCPCCRASWTRYKTDVLAPSCRRCDAETVAGRVWSGQRSCAHVRDRIAYRDAVDKLGSRPRTTSGRPVIITPELRRLWNEVRRARRSDAVLRRGQVFLNALMDETRDNYERLADGSYSRDPVRWSMRPKLRDGKYEVQKLAGRRGGYPEVVRDDRMGSALLGEFRSHILGGVFKIRVNVRVLRGADEIRATLVHEILHALDAEADILGTGHDRLWCARLERFYRMLPPTAYGVALRPDEAKGMAR